MLKKVFKCNNDSIESKLQFYFLMYYIPIVFIIIILDVIFLCYFTQGYLIADIVKFTIIRILFFALIYFLTRKVISKIIKKVILNKLRLISNDFSNIKNNNKFKKIINRGTDEIDNIIYDINEIFSDFNLKLEQEKELSLIDPLTKTYNRRALNKDFYKIIEKSKRTNENVCLLIVDIDNFKSINDKFGHNIGDKVLVELTKSIKHSLRKYDSLYRVGGEEFIVLLPNINSTYKKEILTRIRKNVTYNIKKHVLEIDKNVTISGGCISSENFSLDNKDLLNLMIKKADDLLYKAKNTGKNKIIVV